MSREPGETEHGADVSTVQNRSYRKLGATRSLCMTSLNMLLVDLLDEEQLCDGHVYDPKSSEASANIAIL